MIDFSGDAANTGVLDLGGGTLTNQASGLVESALGVHEIDGALENLVGGTVIIATPEPGTVRLAVTGATTNAGTIAVNASGGFGGSATLDFGAATLTNQTSGTVKFGGFGEDTLSIVGNIDNQGTIGVDTAGASSIRATTDDTLSISNSGTLSVSAVSTLAIGDGLNLAGVFDNTGGVTVDGALDLRNMQFVQDGTLEINAGGSLGLSAGSTLDLGADVTIGSLGTLGLGDGGAATAEIVGSGDLEVRGALVFDNGLLAADTVNLGTLSTNNGRYDVSGSLTTLGAGTVNLEGTLALGGGGTYEFENAVDLTDDRIETLTTVSIAGGGTLTGSQVDGVLQASNTALLTFGGTLTGIGLFEHGATGSTLSTVIDVASMTNSGNLTLSGGTLTSSGMANSGLLDIATNAVLDPGSGGTVGNSGTIDIRDGANLSVGNGLLANSGVIDLSTSGTLSVAAGTLQMVAGGDLTGDGEIRFGGDLEVASGVSFAVTSPSLIFDGGNIGGTGTLQNESDIVFTAAGDIGGTFVNAGALTIAGVAVSATGIELSASGNVTLDGSTGDASLIESDGLLLNSGLVTVTGGVGSLVGFTVSNEAGGSIVVESGAVLRQDGGGEFANAGEISLLGAFEMAGGSAVNSGTLSFVDGRLTLSDNAVFTQNANLTLGIGSEIGLDGASLDGSGSLSIEGLMTLAGGAVVSGVAVANSGTVSLFDGTLTSADVANSGLFDIATDSVMNPGPGGTVANSGTIDVRDGANLSFGDGLLANSGVIDLSTSGTLSVDVGTLLAAT